LVRPPLNPLFCTGLRGSAKSMLPAVDCAATTIGVPLVTSHTVTQEMPSYSWST
jgi:hypothetical protein